MHTLIICDQELQIREFNNQRVLTLKDIDYIHQRPEGTARRNFNANLDRFIECEDYYEIQPDEIRTLGIGRPQGGTPEKLILLTESGYLLLVKSFTDDLAWKIQRALINLYFRVKAVRLPEKDLVDRITRRVLAALSTQIETCVTETVQEAVKEEIAPQLPDPAQLPQLPNKFQAQIDFWTYVLDQWGIFKRKYGGKAGTAALIEKLKTDTHWSVSERALRRRKNAALTVTERTLYNYQSRLRAQGPAGLIDRRQLTRFPDSMDLTIPWKVGFRESSKITFTDEAEVIELLKTLNMRDCVRVKETADKNALKAYPDAQLKEAGVFRVVEDRFFLETRKD